MTTDFVLESNGQECITQSIQPRTFLALALAAALSPTANIQNNTSMTFTFLGTDVSNSMNRIEGLAIVSDAEIIAAIDDLFTSVFSSSVPLEAEFRDALNHDLSDLYA